MTNSLAELRDALDLRQIIHTLTGIRVFSRKICCPFHAEKTPSFSVYRVKGNDRFKCWGGSCGVKGDALDFIRLHEEFSSNKEVLDWLQDHRNEVGLKASLNIGVLLAELDTEERVRKFWTTLEEDCKEALFTPAGAPVRDWLEKRGVDGKTHQYLPIGCFNWDFLINSKSYTPELFKTHGVSGNAKAYPNPIVTFFYYSNPVTLSRIKLRIIAKEGKDDMRVLGSELGGPMGFFGLDLLPAGKTDELLWVEGEMDLLVPQSQFMLQKNDRMDIICCSGSAMTNFGAAKNLEALGTRVLSLWPDNDLAGRDMVAKVAGAHQREGLYINVMWPSDYIPPQGEDKIDPADYCLQGRAIDTVLRKLADSEKYVGDWLAQDACRRFLKLSSPTREDLVRLQERVLHICRRSRLTQLTLGNFLDQVCNLVPALKYEVLYSCALSGMTSTEPERAEMGGRTYVSTDHGYFLEKMGKEEVVQVPISDFRIRLKQWIKAFDPLEDKRRYFGEGEIIRGGSATPVIFRDLDFKNWCTFKTALYAADNDVILDSRTWQGAYDEIIRSLNRGAPEINGTITVGQCPDNRYIMPNWIAQDGTVVPNTDTPVVLGAYRPGMLVPRCETILSENRSELLKGARLIAKELPACYKNPFVPLMMMGHIAASPIVDMLRVPKGALYIEGRTEAGKTLSAELLMNMAWNYPIGESNVSASWTVNSIEMMFMFFSGLPVLLDDAKSEVLYRTRDQFIRMIQNYYDRSGRGRLNRELQQRKAACINGNMIITGESLPFTGESVLNRLVTLRFPQESLDLHRLLDVAKQRSLITALWPYYIAWLQRRQKLEILPFVGVKAGRIKRFVNYIGTGLEHYLQFLVEEYALPQRIMDIHMTMFREQSAHLVADNQGMQKAHSDATMFTETLGQLICSDPAIIDDTPGLTKKKIGYREGNLIYVFPRLAIKLVADTLPGNHFFSPTSLAERLREEHILHVPDNSKSKDGTIRPSASDENPSRRRVWPLKAEMVFGGLRDPMDNPNNQFI